MEKGRDVCAPCKSVACRTRRRVNIWLAADGLQAQPGADEAGFFCGDLPRVLRPASRKTRWRDLPAKSKSYGEHNPKSDVVVEVVRVISVAVGAASVPIIVVPGAAPHHADSTSSDPFFSVQ